MKFFEVQTSVQKYVIICDELKYTPEPLSPLILLLDNEIVAMFKEWISIVEFTHK
jgi:hypothetical protein